MGLDGDHRPGCRGKRSDSERDVCHVLDPDLDGQSGQLFVLVQRWDGRDGFCPVESIQYWEWRSFFGAGIGPCQSERGRADRFWPVGQQWRHFHRDTELQLANGGG